MVDDPAHDRWSSNRGHALGVGGPVAALSQALIAPHPLYLGLGADTESRQAAYRALFRSELDREAVSHIRLALNQSQPLGDTRFLDRIEQVVRCGARLGRVGGVEEAQRDDGTGFDLGGSGFSSHAAIVSDGGDGFDWLTHRQTGSVLVSGFLRNDTDLEPA